MARLADELVALADDMHASGETRDWLTDEYGRAIDRLPYTFDRQAAKAHASRVIARVGVSTGEIERRDLFLIYVPEDRLPIAAPLAIELTKRRVSVAFSEYEVATQEQLAAALDHGMANHGMGALLHTRAFERLGLRLEGETTNLVRILRNPESPSTLNDLITWSHLLKVTGDNGQV
ncbi:MAG TPA: hypothetical protein VJM31_14730 [Vicinamibacterales bacterium]|nr:hypothetical protein [Vicinamibacterales bacterium]